MGLCTVWKYLLGEKWILTVTGLCFKKISKIVLDKANLNITRSIFTNKLFQQKWSHYYVSKISYPHANTLKEWHVWTRNSATFHDIHPKLKKQNKTKQPQFWIWQNNIHYHRHFNTFFFFFASYQNCCIKTQSLPGASFKRSKCKGHVDFTSCFADFFMSYKLEEYETNEI